VRYIMAMVTGMLGAAVADGIIQVNPALNLDLPALDTAPTRTWSSLQIRRFLTGTRDTPVYPIWLFLVTTCARIGETLALRAGDIHLAPDDSGSSTVWLHRTARETGNGTTYDEGTKTSKTGRTVLLEPTLVAVLAPLVDGKAPDAFVFTDDHGRPFTHHRIQGRFDAAIAQLGLPRITLHGLRHSAASLMVANGVPDGIVKSILGHRSVLTTINTYSHISPGMQRIGTAAIHELLGLAEGTTTSRADEAKS
jgi:integrase